MFYFSFRDQAVLFAFGLTEQIGFVFSTGARVFCCVFDTSTRSAGGGERGGASIASCL